MILYHFARMLLYVAIFTIGFLLLAGREQPVCMAVALCLIPVCMLLHWLKKRLWLCVNQKEPIVCVEATLVNHRQQFSGGRGGQRYEKSFLTFRVEQSSQEIEFEVPHAEFDRIQLGAKGPLKYQGWRYLSFR